jgi:plastocyanin
VNRRNAFPALNRKLLAAALDILSVLVFVGCGSDATATPAPTVGAATSNQTDAQEITITARDNVFDPKSYTAPAGKPLKVTLVNAGQNVHKVEVLGLIPETELAAGQSKSVDVVAQQPGSFKLYCETHEDTGMVGEFVVK